MCQKEGSAGNPPGCSGDSLKGVVVTYILKGVSEQCVINDSGKKSVYRKREEKEQEPSSQAGQQTIVGIGF